MVLYTAESKKPKINVVGLQISKLLKFFPIDLVTNLSIILTYTTFLFYCGNMLIQEALLLFFSNVVFNDESNEPKMKAN